MPSFDAFRKGGRYSGTTAFAGPVVLWIWAELAVLHGRGPSVRDLLG
ncbi:hypothetical protein [Nocardia yamanashiensis]|nr:hypothetical protein [Nocardia yamanashiensis]